MSFLSDLIHGQFGHLGQDIAHDPFGSAAAGLGLGAATFGLGDLLLGGGLGLGGLLGGGETAAGAAGAAGAPLDILAGSPLAGTAGTSALGETVAPAALGAGTGGLGFGGTGLGGAVGTDAATLGGLGDILSGAGVGGDVLPSASTLTSGTISPGSSLDAITTNAAIPGGAGAAPAAASPVAPIGGAGAGPTDLTSIMGTGTDPGLSFGGAGSNISGGGNFLDKLTPSALGRGMVNQITSNPLTTALGLGGLGLGIMRGNQAPKGTAQLQGIAGPEAAAGLQNQQYLTTGTLPPGMQASVEQASRDAKAAIISNYASRGLPTDPSKNSALAEELANVDQNAIKTTATLGQQLLQSGLNQTQLSEDVYKSLVGIDQTQQKQISDAIANFAKSLGGGGGVQLKLA